MVWNFPESTSDLIDRPAKEYYDDVDDVHSIMKESNNPLQKLVREFYDDINSINDESTVHPLQKPGKEYYDDIDVIGSVKEGLPKTGNAKKGNTPDYKNVPESSSAVGEKKGQLTESTVHPLQKPGKEYYDDIDVIGSVKEGLPKTGSGKKGNTPDYENVPECSSAVGEKKGQFTESTVHPLQKPGKEYYDDIDVIGSVKEGLPKTGTSQRGSTSSYENVPECTSAIREKKLQVAGLPKTGNEKRGITSDYENVPECSSALGEKKWQLTGHILKPDP
ncbi:uncharacterized protein [Narcine bancroftii]|uniref:uncharacterized protein isoform X3 n=1 Tax=Narcine bancroftii TaxID=1343680 RepID=UPI003831CBFB